ncbi:MAG TPA: O-antigen ligase family protein, partial [Thermodesulfobacteriota bacterium]|nr:O-antigen ligase family protein [Thermodesulfobacteriota bacterium]
PAPPAGPQGGRPAAAAEAAAGRVPVLLLALFLFALYTRPQDLLPALRPLRLVFLLGAGATAAYLADAIGRGAPLLRPARELVLLGALLALAALSIPFSLWPGLSARLFLDQLVKVALAAVLLAHLVDTPGRMRAVIRVLVAAGVYLAAGALYGLASGRTAADYAGRAAGLVGGMFGDPNDLALTLVILIALAGFEAVAARRRSVRVVLVAAIVLMLAGFLATYSRGGLLALVAAGAVGLRRLSRHGRGLAVAAVSVFALAAVALAPEGYGERAASIVQQDRDTRGSIEARLTTLRYGVEILLEHPFPGVGLGAFRIAEGAKHGGLGKWNEAHNAFLQVGAELGWPGLAVYAALAVCTLASVRAAARRATGLPEVAALAHGLETALVGFLVGAMFLSQAYTWHFYVLLGLGVAVRRLAEAAPTGAAEAAPTGVRAPAGAGRLAPPWPRRLGAEGSAGAA